MVFVGGGVLLSRGAVRNLDALQRATGLLLPRPGPVSPTPSAPGVASVAAPFTVAPRYPEQGASCPETRPRVPKAGMRLPGSPAPRSGLSAGLSTELAFAWAQLPVQMGELGQMGV